MVEAFQAFQDQGLEFVLDPVRGLLDLLVAERLRENAAGHSGNAGYGAHPQAHVPGGNGLADGAHAHRVGAQSAEHPDLCWGLVIRSLPLQVHTLLK